MSQTVRWPDKQSSKTHNLPYLESSLNSGREGRCAMILSFINSDAYGSWDRIATDSSLEDGDMTQDIVEVRIHM